MSIELWKEYEVVNPTITDGLPTHINQIELDQLLVWNLGKGLIGYSFPYNAKASL